MLWGDWGAAIAVAFGIFQDDLGLSEVNGCDAQSNVFGEMHSSALREFG
jgi:hypothetical protein